MNKFEVKTDIFEGPLDLLLSLIEKRKLLINDISLSKVADDFMSYVQNMKEIPINEMANFILTASTLLLIKSKSLLPSMELSEEEAGSMEDLEIRLKLYKRFKLITLAIQKIFGKKIIYTGRGLRNAVIVFSPSNDITVKNLHTSIKCVISNFPKENVLPKVIVEKIISLETMIENLAQRIKNDLKLSFGEFTKNHGKSKNKGSMHRVSIEDKKNIIVSFLALLELIKQGIIRASQNSTKEDINIETGSVGIPAYD